MIDLQSSAIHSPFAIKHVGITDFEYPFRVYNTSPQDLQTTIGSWDLSVSLAANRRGTHMSRLMSSLHQFCHEPISLAEHAAFTEKLKHTLDAEDARVRANFPWTRTMKAPVSGLEALTVVNLGFESQSGVNGDQQALEFCLAVKSLCPCSKSISDRGAHNQRSEVHVRLDFKTNCEQTTSAVSWEDLFQKVESQASAALFPILKREDEKYITEYAYDHPVFVEDLVRQVAAQFSDLAYVAHGKVAVKNFESIHVHNCYAEVYF